MQHVERSVYERGSLALSKSSRYGFLFEHLWSVSCNEPRKTRFEWHYSTRDKVSWRRWLPQVNETFNCVCVRVCVRVCVCVRARVCHCARARPRWQPAVYLFCELLKRKSDDPATRNASVVKTVINDGDTPSNHVCHIALETCTCYVAINMARWNCHSLEFLCRSTLAEENVLSALYIVLHIYLTRYISYIFIF